MPVKFTKGLILLTFSGNKFGASKENLRKCLGYFEIEHIDNHCFVSVVVNPEEYYEAFEDNSF